MEEKAKQYLEYLDKEMTILGILSAFCVAVPSLIFERIISTDNNSIAKDFVNSLFTNGILFIIIASALMLNSAAFYYRQRSQLAWYYGQSSLEIVIPDYTGKKLEQWLKEVDSWPAWLPYNLAFWIAIFAGIEYVFAISASFEFIINSSNNIYFSLIPVFVLILLCFWVQRNSYKYPFEERLPYFRIKI